MQFQSWKSHGICIKWRRSGKRHEILFSFPGYAFSLNNFLNILEIDWKCVEKTQVANARLAYFFMENGIRSWKSHEKVIEFFIPHFQCEPCYNVCFVNNCRSHLCPLGCERLQRVCTKDFVHAYCTRREADLQV